MRPPYLNCSQRLELRGRRQRRRALPFARRTSQALGAGPTNERCRALNDMSSPPAAPLLLLVSPSLELTLELADLLHRVELAEVVLERVLVFVVQKLLLTLVVPRLRLLLALVLALPPLCRRAPRHRNGHNEALKPASEIPKLCHFLARKLEIARQNWRESERQRARERDR